MPVFDASLPPVTITRPSDRTAMPGQNISWPVLLTVRCVTKPVAKSRIAVWVRPWPPLHLVGIYEDHTSSLLFGNRADATGTTGKPMTGPQEPIAAGRPGAPAEARRRTKPAGGKDT